MGEAQVQKKKEEILKKRATPVLAQSSGTVTEQVTGFNLRGVNKSALRKCVTAFAKSNFTLRLN